MSSSNEDGWSMVVPNDGAVAAAAAAAPARLQTMDEAGPQMGHVEDAGARGGGAHADCAMEFEFHGDLGDDELMSLGPADGFLNPEDDPFGEQCADSGEAVVHRAQLMRFNVMRGERRVMTPDQPLRHTSSGAASRHCAPPPLIKSTMKRSHSDTDFMGFPIETSQSSRLTMKKSASHSMLVDRHQDWDSDQQQAKFARF